jgi:hypothetical protein
MYSKYCKKIFIISVPTQSPILETLWCKNEEDPIYRKSRKSRFSVAFSDEWLAISVLGIGLRSSVQSSCSVEQRLRVKLIAATPLR